MVPCRIAGRRRPRCQLDERLQPLLCCRGKQASEAPVEQERQDRDTRLRAASTCHSHGGRFWPVDGLPLQRARVGCRSKGPMTGTRCALSRELGLRKAFSVAPELLASPDALGNLRLKSGRTECKPVLADLVDKAAALFGAKAHQPIERLFLRPIADGDEHIDRQPLPGEICREHDRVRHVRSHPIRQRRRRHQPSANKFTAGMLRPLRIDRAAMINAEGTGFARANLVSSYLDLQPAVAARRARTAASSLTLVFHRLFHWLAHVGSGLADFRSA